MPKYRPETARARAQRLIKLHNENGNNQTRVAELEGVTPSAINHRLSKQPVQDCLKEFLNSDKLKKKLIKVAKEGLSAKQYDMIGKPHPAHGVRHRYWRDCVVATGNLDSDSQSGHRIINIIHNYHRPKEELKDNANIRRD